VKRTSALETKPASVLSHSGQFSSGDCLFAYAKPGASIYAYVPRGVIGTRSSPLASGSEIPVFKNNLARVSVLARSPHDGQTKMFTMARFVSSRLDRDHVIPMSQLLQTGGA
jgi:hypothetical protein